MNKLRAPFVSESLSPEDYHDGWRVAVMYKKKVYTGKPGEIHVQVIAKHHLDYNNVIPGYVDNNNQWRIQFESDLPD